MDVVDQLDVKTELGTQTIKHLDGVIDIGRWLEDGRWSDARRPRLLDVLRGLASRAVGRIAGDGELHADVPVALGLPMANLVFERGEVLGAGVCVERSRLAHLAPEKLVDRQAH